MKAKNHLIIAHRGESFDAPENTLASINLAWERGATAIEIDIQLSKDKEIVVIHDEDTLRVSGEKHAVEETNLSNLKTLDFGSFKGDQWKNERIPTLFEVIETVPENGKLIIEIKSNNEILEKLKSELAHSDLEDHQIEIIAFNLGTLIKAKQLMPGYRMLWLLPLDYSRPWWLVLINKRRIIKIIKKYQLDGVNVWAGDMLNKEFIETFKSAGLLVYAWTVNKPKKAKALLEYEIDGITTDRAAWMTKQLQQRLILDK